MVVGEPAGFPLFIMVFFLVCSNDCHLSFDLDVIFIVSTISYINGPPRFKLWLLRSFMVALGPFNVPLIHVAFKPFQVSFP